MSSNLLQTELLTMALPYRSLGIAASVLLLVLALPAKAERAMSCPDFRLALWRAIDDDGNKVARHHGTDTRGRRQAPAHLVISDDGQQATMQDDDLFA